MTIAETSLSSLRKHLLEVLEKNPAHVGYDKAVKDMPAQLRGVAAPRQPHTAWRLIEHMRLAQRDILEFSRDGSHESPDWPEGYWPNGDAPPSAAAWNHSISQFKKDRQAMLDLIADPKRDLLAPIPHAPGKQTLAREAMLLIDHTAYHIGQLVMLRRVLGAWKG